MSLMRYQWKVTSHRKSRFLVNMCYLDFFPIVSIIVYNCNHVLWTKDSQNNVWKYQMQREWREIIIRKCLRSLIKKKSKHHIRLKCIRKELNQTRKNIEIITYTCKRVFSDTFYFLYKICYVATFKVILLQILYI